jgi:hypothetical protein
VLLKRHLAAPLGLLMTLVILALSACGGGGGQDSAEGGKGVKATMGTAPENPLVGTWRRVRKCEEQVRLMKEAGLAELIPKWISPSEFSHAAAAQRSASSGDPCRGVRGGRLPHDHVFYKDGRFASVDDEGEFVDDRTIEFGDPPGNMVHFRISDDHDTVTFYLEIPDMDKCSQHRRDNTAYQIAVFYPGLPWKRISPEEQWPGEV